VHNWTVLADLATALGTLVLAVATFASVRSANRAARTAERGLLVALRPLLIPSRLTDEVQKVGFGDGKWLRLQGGCGHAEVDEEKRVIYLAASLRNVGPGIAVLDSWRFSGERMAGRELGGLDGFRRLTRDLYLAPGEIGFWQGAFRDDSEPVHAEAWKAITSGSHMSVDVLYRDYEGGQSMVTRFGLSPREDGQGWILSAGRHWHLDGHGPRDQEG